MKIHVVLLGKFRPQALCAFLDAHQAETFMSILAPDPEIRDRNLCVESMKLMKHVGPSFRDLVEDEDEVNELVEPIFLCYSPTQALPIRVTRDLDDARLAVHGMSGKGDVVAVDLVPAGAKIPSGPRFQYVSSFGAHWPLSMHERWQRHMSYFDPDR